MQQLHKEPSTIYISGLRSEAFSIHPTWFLNRVVELWILGKVKDIKIDY